MNHLENIVRLTNAQLVLKSKHVTNGSEIIKFFGIIVLMSRHQFGARRDLWAFFSKFKYISAPNFGAIMSRHDFETLRACIRFCENGNLDDDGSPSRWALVDDFVTAINRHRAMYVNPPELICVDESMSRWYGLGGEWIDIGLPTYRAIDRKPDNVSDIKTSACGKIALMLQLQMVENTEDNEQRDKDDSMTHGAMVTKQLVEPWKNSNLVVCGESYFASVDTVNHLYSIRLRFIGVGKSAHRHFPAKYQGLLRWTDAVSGFRCELTLHCCPFALLILGCCTKDVKDVET